MNMLLCFVIFGRQLSVVWCAYLSSTPDPQSASSWLRNYMHLRINAKREVKD
jgi:hypothetical protein